MQSSNSSYTSINDSDGQPHISRNYKWKSNDMMPKKIIPVIPEHPAPNKCSVWMLEEDCKEVSLYCVCLEQLDTHLPVFPV